MEHLDLVCEIKNMNPSQKKAAIENTIQVVMLTEVRDKPVK